MYQVELRVRDARAAHYIFAKQQVREEKRRLAREFVLFVACALAPLALTITMIGGSP